MAVYEQTYRRYEGSLTPEVTRFLVLPRYSLREVFSSKLFLAFFVLCFIPPLVAMGIVWVLHNSTFLAFAQMIFRGETPQIEIGETFCHALVLCQGVLALFLTILVAPALVAKDLANNALPLYLSRPFSRWEYVAGKISILAFLLSAVTWVPILAVLALKAFLAKGWLMENGDLFLKTLFGSGIWITLLCLTGLAVSATLRWKAMARVALFALFFLTWGVAGFVNQLFDRFLELPWGDVLSPMASIRTIWHSLFEIPSGSAIPTWSAWAALIVFSLLALGLLSRKLRAYEVVS